MLGWLKRKSYERSLYNILKALAGLTNEVKGIPLPSSPETVKLYQLNLLDTILWSSISVEESFLLVLEYYQTTRAPEPVIVAAYRTFQVAAAKKEADLLAHVSDEGRASLRDLEAKYPDLYRLV